MRYFYLLRLHHWPKNAFIFIPAFFAGVLRDWTLIFILVQGFFCFGFVSSAVYIINDYRDRETDRLHPTKKNRPLASGKISETTAGFSFLLFLVQPITRGVTLLTGLVVNVSLFLCVHWD